MRRTLPAAVFALLAVSTLAGCSRYYWSKPGSSAEQFARDSQECEKEATVSPAAAASVQQDVYRRCLSARGYARESLVIPPATAHRGVEKWR
jgi:hypothetical protein